MVPQNSVFSENSGVLGADICLQFPLLRSCYFRSSVRLLDPTLQALSPGWSGNGDAGSWGGGKNPTGASILISRPTLSPITSTWYSSLAPLLFASADPQIPISHPALPKTPRPDVYPTDASENRAHVRSSPFPTSRTSPLFSQVHSRLRLFSSASNQKSSLVQFIS